MSTPFVSYLIQSLCWCVASQRFHRLVIRFFQSAYLSLDLVPSILVFSAFDRRTWWPRLFHHVHQTCLLLCLKIVSKGELLDADRYPLRRPGTHGCTRFQPKRYPPTEAVANLTRDEVQAQLPKSDSGALPTYDKQPNRRGLLVHDAKPPNGTPEPDSNMLHIKHILLKTC